MTGPPEICPAGSEEACSLHRYLDLGRVSEDPSNAVGSTVWHFSSLPSTNNLLQDLYRRGLAAHGAVVVADEQTAGRGRRGRRWSAPPGSGLLVSILLTPLAASESYALGVLAAREAIVRRYELDVRVKWPNDLLLDGRKVCGILVDRLDEGAVVGLGINTNMKTEAAVGVPVEATSLRAHRGAPVDHAELLVDLLARFEHWYAIARRHPTTIFREWRLSLDTIGQVVEVETPTERWTGRALDVADDGSLLVSNGKRTVRVYAADVRVKAANPL
ncbi:MAG TPA: biotin--[acetyl-CoA-carboxylase] ligase [Chloroflexota bacterium]|nr:biotin--[acetyl-CoA-carboxylase] ligase [Chloroflexota bacterium]